MKTLTSGDLGRIMEAFKADRYNWRILFIPAEGDVGETRPWVVETYDLVTEEHELPESSLQAFLKLIEACSVIVLVVFGAFLDWLGIQNDLQYLGYGSIEFQIYRTYNQRPGAERLDFSIPKGLKIISMVEGELRLEHPTDKAQHVVIRGKFRRKVG